MARLTGGPAGLVVLAAGPGLLVMAGRGGRGPLMMSRWIDGVLAMMKTCIYTLGHGHVWISLTYQLFYLLMSGLGQEGIPPILH